MTPTKPNSLIDEENLESLLSFELESKKEYEFYKNTDRPPSKYEIEIYDTLQEYTKSRDSIVLVDVLNILEIKPPLDIEVWYHVTIEEIYKRVEKYKLGDNKMEEMVALKRKQRQEQCNEVSDLVYEQAVAKVPFKQIVLNLKEKGYLRTDLTTDWCNADVVSILAVRKRKGLPSTTFSRIHAGSNYGINFQKGWAQ